MNYLYLLKKRSISVFARISVIIPKIHLSLVTSPNVEHHRSDLPLVAMVQRQQAFVLNVCTDVFQHQMYFRKNHGFTETKTQEKRERKWSK